MMAGKVDVVCGYGELVKVLRLAAFRRCPRYVPRKSIDQCLAGGDGGYQVVTMEPLRPQGEFFFMTATGNAMVIHLDHMRQMKDRAIVAISAMSILKFARRLRNTKWEEVKPQVDEVVFPDGKRLLVLAKAVWSTWLWHRGIQACLSGVIHQPDIGAGIDLWDQSRPSIRMKLYSA